MVDENQVTENVKPIPGSKKFLGCGCVVWGLAGLLGFCILVALFLPAVSSCHEAVRRIVCRNNLKHIGLALHNYHETYGCYPPAYTVDEHGRRMHSWRALILPFTEAGEEKFDYDFSQPWNSPENIAFAEKSPLFQLYSCPNDCKSDPDRRYTSYVMLVGPRAFANGATARKREDITDGLRNTIAVAEMSRSGIFWTEPRDLDTSVMSFKLNDPHQIGLRSEHTGGLNVLFADGSVCYLSDSMDLNFYEAMTTIDGGEKIDEW